MQNDKITLKDLSVFTADAGGGIFALLDHTTTQTGREQLQQLIQHPPDTFEQLQQLQDTVKFWTKNEQLWPEVISNGTIVMLEKFFEAADSVGAPPTGFTKAFGALFQKLLNRNEYFFTQFSISHLSDFLQGCTQLVALLERDDLPQLLRSELEAIAGDLQHRLTPALLDVSKKTPYATLMELCYKARREIKNVTYRLMARYARLDAWQSMARATVANKWVFPVLQPALPVVFEAKALYHPLLEYPVSYDINFSDNRNFLLLTGANMSGKTTFLRALGVGALLAHLGMGVPAASMHISFLSGIITSMQVEDNIMRGESYFFAEVQRMKHTAGKLVQSAPHLVLMDELFKGTNVHDAYECTRAVVDGLLQRPHHIMVLSTHLYEVAQHFSGRKELFFAYFVTNMAENGDFKFTYELKPGISDDRIGYRILRKEGVIDLLNKPG